MLPVAVLAHRLQVVFFEFIYDIIFGEGIAFGSGKATAEVIACEVFYVCDNVVGGNIVVGVEPSREARDRYRSREAEKKENRNYISN